MDFASTGRGTGWGSQFAARFFGYAHTPQNIQNKYVVRPMSEKREKTERVKTKDRSEAELIQLSLSLLLSKTIVIETQLYLLLTAW